MWSLIQPAFKARKLLWIEPGCLQWTCQRIHPYALGVPPTKCEFRVASTTCSSGSADRGYNHWCGARHAWSCSPGPHTTTTVCCYCAWWYASSARITYGSGGYVFWVNLPHLPGHRDPAHSDLIDCSIAWQPSKNDSLFSVTIAAQCMIRLSMHFKLSSSTQRVEHILIQFKYYHLCSIDRLALRTRIAGLGPFLCERRTGGWGLRTLRALSSDVSQGCSRVSSSLAAPFTACGSEQEVKWLKNKLFKIEIKSINV